MVKVLAIGRSEKRFELAERRSPACSRGGSLGRSWPARRRSRPQSFLAIIASGQVEPLALPACSPNLNAYAERWVRSVKEECLSKVILFGERSLRRALSDYVEHFTIERQPNGSVKRLF